MAAAGAAGVPPGVHAQPSDRFTLRVPGAE
ncbi:unnamed protein product, partial [Prorocentrum cordatum]